MLPDQLQESRFLSPNLARPLPLRASRVMFLEVRPIEHNTVGDRQRLRRVPTGECDFVGDDVRWDDGSATVEVFEDEGDVRLIDWHRTLIKDLTLVRNTYLLTKITIHIYV